VMGLADLCLAVCTENLIRIDCNLECLCQHRPPSVGGLISIPIGLVVGQFNCGGQATVGGVVPDMASITMDIIKRLKKNKVAAAAEPARAYNLARHDNVREG
jgi:hypothetical protein